MEKLAEKTGINTSEAMQLCILKALNYKNKHHNQETLNQQITTLKKRLGVYTDGEDQHVSNIKTDYTKKDGKIKVNK